eukprot:TRINITY_DN12764_c0_g2_i2.p1 TRINITY_DN12764_c0_g2~~TRINITY_DN12764_c0_g2_i2.p1  ORF type:complete len:192 (+),score=57.61 TRINITY_DN12764_c0_g2_i2:706-1281(+)
MSIKRDHKATVLTWYIQLSAKWNLWASQEKQCDCLVRHLFSSMRQLGRWACSIKKAERKAVEEKVKKVVPKKSKVSSTTVESESAALAEEPKVKRMTPVDYFVASLSDKEKLIYESFRNLVKEQNIQGADESLVFRALKTKQYHLISSNRFDVEKGLNLLKRAVKYIKENKPLSITFDEIKDEYDTGVNAK